MLSIILLVRNTSQLAAQCLSSVLRAIRVLDAAGLEIILIDDASDATQQIPELFAQLRAQLPSATRSFALQFRERQHYTRALASGLSMAKGESVLFVSHDMLLTADYLRTLLAVAASDGSIALVRGTSPYVDCFPQYVVTPPLPIRTFEELDAFARYVSDYWGLHRVEDTILTGDSMLITRRALDKIGVFDPRYFGYFGDIDFGLRLQRAGFKMVCARGAWLWHEGAGAYKNLQTQTGQDYSVIHAQRMQTINAAYGAFRDKWSHSLPPLYPGTEAIDFTFLRNLPPRPGGDYQPPITIDPATCDVLGF